MTPATLELESAHAYAADFGSVLEWCTLRTAVLFTTPDDSTIDRLHLLEPTETEDR
jgi:hypothetical protein